jgi:hypothetical protein
MKRILFSPIGLVTILAVPVLLFSFYIGTLDVEPNFESSDPSVRRNRTQSIGGIDRPVSDIAAKRTSINSKQPPSGDNQKIEHTFGKDICPKLPRLTKGQNKQMDSVIEAIETGNYPERLSPFHTPSPFDVEAWRADNSIFRSVDQSATAAIRAKAKEKLVAFEEENNDSPYLDIAEPGRIYDVAQPASDVAPLTTASSSYFEVADGEAIRVSVQTEASGVATFTAFGVGEFDNGLTTITLEADEDGVASATYVTSTGSELTDIVAGSPMRSGTVRFTLRRTFTVPPTTLPSE